MVLVTTDVPRTWASATAYTPVPEFRRLLVTNVPMAGYAPLSCRARTS